MGVFHWTTTMVFGGIIKYSGVAKWTTPEQKKLIVAIPGCEMVSKKSPTSSARVIRIGDSVAIDGVCLTVISINTVLRLLEFDVSTHTCNLTTLGVKRGEAQWTVNVDFPLVTGDSIGGHIVSGHVSGRGYIHKDDVVEREVGMEVWIRLSTLALPRAQASIAVNGVSLTVAAVDSRRRRIMVALIPETLKTTTFRSLLEADAWVNVELVADDVAVVRDDAYWMREALREGEKGRFVATPNPWVGCVIIDPDTNEVLARGHHRGPGTPHAEVAALDALDSPDAATWCTVYTTLEPCHRYDGDDEWLKARSGCDKRLIEARVGRVVIGMLDADKRVINRGIEELEAAKITVDVLTGPIAEDVRDSFAEYIAARDAKNPVEKEDVVEFDPANYDSLESAIEALQRGEWVIVADEADRENEFDLVGVAAHCTEKKMAFFLNYTTGQHCLVLSPERARYLGIKHLVPPEENQGHQQTPFGEPVDAKACRSTGVDALDRSITVAALAVGQAGDFTRAGHTATLISNPGGILARRGHTEASIALAGHVGLEPAEQAMVIGEMMYRKLDHPMSGKMMRTAGAQTVARQHGLKMIHVSQLLDNLQPLVTTKIPLAMPSGEPVEWEMSLFACKESPEHVHIVCSYGDVRNSEDTILVRVHSECFTGDLMRSVLCDCRQQLNRAECLITGAADFEESKKNIAAAGKGVIIIPANQEGRGIGLVNKLRAYNLQQIGGLDTIEANLELDLPADSRHYDDIPYLLRSIGVTRVHLLTENPDKISAIADKMNDMSHSALSVLPQSEHARKYLKTKHSYFAKVQAVKPMVILFAISEMYQDECQALMERIQIEITKQASVPVNFDVVVAPATRELPWYVKQQFDRQARMRYAGVVAIGITMKGGTRHNDVIATSAGTGLIQLELTYNVPITTAIISASTMEIVKARTRGDKCCAVPLATTLLKSISVKHTD